MYSLVSVNANAIQNGISPQWLSLARLFSRLISMSVPRATRGGDQAHAHNMLMRARLIGRERKNPPPVTIPNIILVEYVFGRRKKQKDIFCKRSEVKVLFCFSIMYFIAWFPFHLQTLSVLFCPFKICNNSNKKNHSILKGKGLTKFLTDRAVFRPAKSPFHPKFSYFDRNLKQYHELLKFIWD